MKRDETPEPVGGADLIARLNQLLDSGGQVDRAYTAAVMAAGHPAGPEAGAEAWHHLADLLAMATAYARRLADAPMPAPGGDR